MTALDRGGNAVAGAVIDVAPDADGKRNIVGPAEKSNKVAADNDVDKDRE